MFTRIVKMTFEPSKIESFLENFNKNKQKIRSFEGCKYLKIYRDKNNKSVFFSYSYWESETHLNNYRNSELFKGIWAVTKTKFADKPEAWSVETIDELI